MNRFARTLLGAFILGAIVDVIRPEYPWRGEGALFNFGSAFGSGFALTVIVAVVWLVWRGLSGAVSLIRGRQRDP